MTGKELRAIRQRMGLGWVEFGRVLGYGGSRNTVQVKMQRYEMFKEVPPPVVHRVRMIEQRNRRYR